MRARYPGRSYDEGGQLASQGRVSEELLTELLRHPFFAAPLPKTTGPELFGAEFLRGAQQQSGTTSLSVPDLLATLTRLSARGVAEALRQHVGPAPGLAVYVSGGGLHNALLMRELRAQLPGCRFGTTADLGVLPDAKEALLFAVLANETLAGTPFAIGRGRQAVPAVALGKISFPQ